MPRIETTDSFVRRASARPSFGRVGRAVVVALGLIAAAPALAQTNAYVCNDLTARLAALAKVPASNADRWAGAIAEQRAALEQNRAMAARCAGAIDTRCAAVVARGQQMTTNLAALERQYAGMGGDRAAASPERARLQALMAQLHCNERPPAGAVVPPGTSANPGSRSQVTIGGVPFTTRAGDEMPPGVGGATIRTPPPSRPTGLFAALFGSTATVEPESETPPDELDPALAQAMSGSFRTLCVRTCDGYFFPISFNAPRGRLGTDANVCKALCPGTETRLYFHHNPGEEAEQALSADTMEPLTRLPNAFRYRTQVVPDCRCGRPDPSLLPAAAGGLLGGRGLPTRGFALDDVPSPHPRPGPDADPETQAEIVAGFEPGAPIPVVVATEGGDGAQATAEPAPPPKVRTVGPKYFGDR